MKYRLVQKRNPQDPEGPKKWYANAVNVGKMDMKDFAREIAGRSSLTWGDIENVLNNFVEELPTFLKLGISLKLGEFGTLRLSISSEGVDNPKDFDTSMIKKVRVIFTPGPLLLDALGTITFEEFELLTVPDDEEEAETPQA